MKLAFVCTDRNLAVFGSSGRAAYIREVLKALIQRGAHIDLFAARLDGDRPDELHSMVIHKLSAFTADLSANDSAMIRANRELRRLLEGSRCGPFTAVLERFSPCSYAGIEYARSHKIAGILEVTDSGIDEFARLSVDMQNSSMQTLEASTICLAASPEAQSFLNSREVRWETPASSIDPERYSTGARLTLRKTAAFTVGYLGSLESWDAVQPLVEAFTLLHNKLSEARLVVEGEGAAKGRMIAELSRRGLLGTACFLGKVPARRIPGILAAVDVTVLWGKTDVARVRDSMVASVPVITCETDGPVRENFNGLFYREGDAQSLFAALNKLHQDRILRLRLGSSARRSVLSDRIWDEIASGILRHLPQPAEAFSMPVYQTPSAHTAL